MLMSNSNWNRISKNIFHFFNISTHNIVRTKKNNKKDKVT